MGKVKVKNTKLFGMVGVLSLILILTPAASSFGEVKVLKVGHTNAATSHYQKACELFKQLVEKKTNGTIKIEIYPAEQLGGNQEEVQGLSLGTIAIHLETDLSLAPSANYSKLWAVFYIFDNLDEAEKFKSSPLNKKLHDQLLKVGIRQVGYYSPNFTFNMLSRKPVYKLGDLKGLKNRCMQVDVMVKCWKSLGSNPVALSFGEVYTSLSTGLVDAMDNPIGDMYHERFHEVTKYLCMTKAMQSVVCWNFSEKVWKSLAANEQKAIMEAAEEVKNPMREWADKDLSEALQAFKKQGIEVIDTDLTGFSERINENIDNILGGDRELIDMYRQIRKAQSK